MRQAKLERNTKETQICLTINLDGSGQCEINTGMGFFDHMLQLFACHSSCDIKLNCKGDLSVDGHHSVEDIGIVLGKAIAAALGDKKGIERYSQVSIPMDECLADVALDISGRPFLVYNAQLDGKIGDFDAELTQEFFRALSVNAGLTLHINVRYGTNKHHISESIFKGFAKAFKNAVKITGDKIPSSKGMLE